MSRSLSEVYLNFCDNEFMNNYSGIKFRSDHSKLKVQRAFTLAELLIALAILGVIATFTIPKILNSTNNSEWDTVAKEVAGMMSEAYQAYQIENAADATTNFSDITPYMNYIKVDTISDMDQGYGTAGVTNCGAGSLECLKLHSGALIRYPRSRCFYGTTSKNMLLIRLDPDGKVSSDTSANAYGKSLELYLYYNGRVVTGEGILPDSITSNYGCSAAITYQPAPAIVPPWFSW